MHHEIVRSYLDFCNAKLEMEDNILDLSHVNFIYPTLLLPTFRFISNSEYKARLNHNNVGYAKRMLNPSSHINKTYIPYRSLPLSSKRARLVIDKIIKLIEPDSEWEYAFDYLITELIDNIYQHSEFSSAHIFAQKFPKKKYTETCIIDNGITIPGSFSKFGLEYNNDADAIKQAVNGTSTKDEFNHRGWGLNSIVKAFSNNMGQLFIASGDGAILFSQGKTLLYSLEENYSMDGTLVTMRVPSTQMNIDGFCRKR